MVSKQMEILVRFFFVRMTTARMSIWIFQQVANASVKTAETHKARIANTHTRTFSPSSNPGRILLCPVLQMKFSEKSNLDPGFGSKKVAVYLILSCCEGSSPTVYPLPIFVSLKTTARCSAVGW